MIGQEVVVSDSDISEQVNLLEMRCVRNGKFIALTIYILCEHDLTRISIGHITLCTVVRMCAC